jgi:N-acetylglucosaminyldiphosphoundecaprenol N-acetyl-beta-D-mannosaminyltransferase
MEKWISEFRPVLEGSGKGNNIRPALARVITLTNVHAIVEARRNNTLRLALSHADVVCPDGMPLVWLGRGCGFFLPGRVSGPDLMVEFFRQTNKSGYSHYFLGGGPAVPGKLAANLKIRFPRLEVAGYCSPPFRSLTCEEDEQLVADINAASPEVLWVALGCPKQEAWIQEHRHRLQVAVILGVGQAFDIHAGTLKRAPRWMRDAGLEWFFRMCAEPRRLWKRYFDTNSRFLFLLLGTWAVAFVQRFGTPRTANAGPREAARRTMDPLGRTRTRIPDLATTRRDVRGGDE